MKAFLLEIATIPVTTLRLQFAPSMASVCILAENGGVPLKSVKELTYEEEESYVRSGVQHGLSGLHMNDRQKLGQPIGHAA